MSLFRRPERLAARRDDDALPTGTGDLGLRIFLASLTMLFGATLIGYLFIRLRANEWPPMGVPPLPSWLALSTVLIVVSSGSAQLALSASKRGRGTDLRRWLAVTFALGVVFLVAQTVAWLEMMPAVRQIGARDMIARVPIVDPLPRQYAFLFFTLTVLHALHVLGGLVALALAIRGAAGALTPATLARRVRHGIVYWHFLDLVWVVMYAVLLL